MTATIEQAQAYLDERLFKPALAASDLPSKVRSTINTTRVRLKQFRRPGDILIYLDRFQGSASPEMRESLRSAGLNAFEDLRSGFRAYLGSSANDVTTLNDFVIGATYTSWDILIFARVYDPRHGGIFLIPKDPPFDAIFVKATLSGGKYANEWLEKGQRLKYYFYSIDGKYDPDYKYNAAIRQSGAAPIFVFIKDAAGFFVLEGVFEYVTEHADSDGSRWFELLKRDSTLQPYQITDREYTSELDAKVTAARADNSESRRARLAKAPKLPRQVLIQATNYLRSADVIAEVLERANGYCEHCMQPAPFNRKSDGSPYLEVHHKIQLAFGGEDTVENAIALCPNCHRKRHYG